MPRPLINQSGALVGKGGNTTEKTFHLSQVWVVTSLSPPGFEPAISSFLFVCLGFTSFFQHTLGYIGRERKTCHRDTMPCSFRVVTGVLLHALSHIHATAFDKPVGSTGWEGRQPNRENIPPFSSMGGHEFVPTRIRTRDLQHTRRTP